MLISDKDKKELVELLENVHKDACNLYKDHNFTQERKQNIVDNIWDALKLLQSQISCKEEEIENDNALYTCEHASTCTFKACKERTPHKHSNRCDEECYSSSNPNGEGNGGRCVYTHRQIVINNSPTLN
jgi:hypothetical protein